jgi:hypothetical protein
MKGKKYLDKKTDFSYGGSANEFLKNRYSTF